jgi:hypothetical protein
MDKSILPSLLETENKKLEQLASAFVRSRQYRYGWAWVEGLEISNWSITQIVQLLSYLPFTDEAWKLATALLAESEGEYWVRTSANPYEAQGDLGVAVDKLIQYQRPYAAINCLNRVLHDRQPLDKSRSVKALLAAVSSPEPSYTTDAYHIVEIIKALQNEPGTDPEDLFQIEWAYLSLLDQHLGASPKLLEKRLAWNPAFFCEVIRLVYRSKNDAKSEKEPSEQKKSIVINAWRLLREWKTPPGMQDDGVFSREQFIEWLQQVKATCRESGHFEIALTHVGQVLVYCPPDPQGLWIDRTVAEVLNAKDAEHMRNGFCVGLSSSSSREAHWVDPTGKPECELAEQYRQKAEEIENAGYHRLSISFRKLAESYDIEAERIIEWHKSLGE